MDFVNDCPGAGCSYRVGTVPAGRRGDGLPVPDGDRERAADFDFVLLGEVEVKSASLIFAILIGAFAVGVGVDIMRIETTNRLKSEIKAAVREQQCGQAGSTHD